MSGGRRRLYLGSLVALLLLLLVPFGVQNSYYLQVLFRIFVFAALGLAWNLVGGYAGQLSLGHVAYFGVGAYAFTLLVRDLHWNPWWSVLGGVGFSVVAALLIGSITFRLRGPYFTLATIATAEILRLLVLNLKDLTGGAVGLPTPALFAGASTDRAFYAAAVLLAAVAYALNLWADRSRFGYYLMAIREDEDTAMAVGVNPARTKLLALLPSAAITSLAGSLYASSFHYIQADYIFSIDISNQAAIVAMLGGAGTALGPVLGSVILTTASELFKEVFQTAHLLIYGILIILVVLFLPGGVIGFFGRRSRRRAQREPGPFAGSLSGEEGSPRHSSSSST
ncbi:MAG: branched-chain amino acid ABC transporter permease [Bacillota bacterium]|nr:branched-chain amino acid ABC transporter permease [Bacillota bacterium]